MAVTRISPTLLCEIRVKRHYDYFDPYYLKDAAERLTRENVKHVCYYHAETGVMSAIYAFPTSGKDFSFFPMLEKNCEIKWLIEKAESGGFVEHQSKKHSFGAAIIVCDRDGLPLKPFWVDYEPEPLHEIARFRAPLLYSVECDWRPDGIFAKSIYDDIVLYRHRIITQIGVSFQVLTEKINKIPDEFNNAIKAAKEKARCPDCKHIHYHLQAETFDLTRIKFEIKNT